MTGFVLDHLWQSTLFAAVAGLLTLALRSNSARIRHAIWFAASVKFLVPFAALMALGAALPARVAPPLSPPSFLALQPMAQPFSAPHPMLLETALSGPGLMQILSPYLLALWAIGFAAVAGRWLLRWSRLRRTLRQAVDCPLTAPVPVKMAPSLLEPGLVGIWRPVILLPQGIAARLSQAEMDAILAHEICHLSRRDNLLAAVHMLVEALFWFHPLVWWLGARLNAERERACDESVLAQGQPPQVYAMSILKVCQFYLHSPLDCAAGISGADLKIRMETIMEDRFSLRLNAGKKLMLAGAVATAIAAPIALGFLAPSGLSQAQATVLGLAVPALADNNDGMTPAIAQCLRDNAAKVEIVESDLNKATDYLVANACALPVAAEQKRLEDLHQQAVQQLSRRQCEDRVAQQKKRNPSAPYDDCGLQTAHMFADASSLGLSGGGARPAAVVSMAAKLILDLRASRYERKP